MTPLSLNSFLVIMAIFQALDLYTTFIALRHGAIEESWLIGKLANLLGHALVAALVLKLVFLGFLYHYPVGAYVQAVLIGIYVWIIYNNFAVIKKLKNA